MNHMCLLLIAFWSRLDYHYLFRVADIDKVSLYHLTSQVVVSQIHCLSTLTLERCNIFQIFASARLNPPTRYDRINQIL